MVTEFPGFDIGAKYCNERYDGSGYPEGLKGEEIPLVSRIMSIVDVYDALTSKRPYKEPFSHEKAMALITEGVGRNFDPKLVSEFIEIESRIRECLEAKEEMIVKEAYFSIKDR